ncbi:MAG TPA: tetratricopeptide repeat protein [Verrucomicrobiae bacterium]
MKLFFRFVPITAFVPVALFVGAIAWAAEPGTNAALTTPAAEQVGVAEASELLRQLQSRIEFNQHTIDLLREQAVSAKHNEDVTAARLKLIEMTLTERHERELAGLQAANRLTLTIVAVVAGAGFLAVIVLGVFLFRTTNKLAAFPTLIPAPALLGEGAPTRALLAGTTSAAANERLLNVVGLLEKRFLELERSLENRAAAAADAPIESTTAAPDAAADKREPSAKPAPDRAQTLLSRGQDLLNMDKADEALACFEEAAALDPNNTDALVKRGKVLEKLGRMDEALKSYDRALALDDTLTVAHLGKGGVFNRLERFGEALECYERALRTQSKATLAEAAKG